jgi:EpsI family protein
VKVGLLDVPEVDMPDWTFRELPMRIGDWHGEEANMDPKTILATGAQTVVNRAYRDEAGHLVSIHTAMFNNPADGVIHSPMVCYRAAGWEKLGESKSSLQVSDKLAIPISISTWELQGKKVIVVYWYQLGNHVLFGRWDLGLKVRWSLAGKPKWPALIKVMLQIPVDEGKEPKSAILSLAKEVAKWENKDAHRNAKGMLGVPKDSSDGG